MTELRAWVYTKNQLSEALGCEHFTGLYVPLRLAELVPEDRRGDVILLPPEYLADCEETVVKRLDDLKKIGFTNVLAHTVGHIVLSERSGCAIHGGNRLNCTNSETVRAFAEQGLTDIILSPELTVSRINALEKPVPVGIIAYGHLPLMLTRRCPISDGKPCGTENCGRCITDRRGNKLRVICSENTVEILNTDVLMLSGRLSEFDVSFFVLRFTVEENVKGIAELYANDRKADIERLTRGLYYRGVE